LLLLLHSQIKELLKLYEYTKNRNLGVSFLLIGKKNTKVVLTLKTRWGKNYLFAGSREAAQRSAMLYSLLGTCKLYGVEPFAWLLNMLEKNASHPTNRISELLPHVQQ
jgi:hypothetical protein